MLSRTRVCSAAAVLLFVTCASAFSAAANVGLEMKEGLAGLVSSDRSPLSSARVYAYQVSDLSLTKATTGGDGRFLFETLPAGVYKIIAYKNGFVPAIVLVTRAAKHASDYLEFELVAEAPVASGDSDDFWSVRRKIPTDVLRQIELAEMGLEGAEIEDHGEGVQVEAKIAAGFDRTGTTDLSRTDAQLGFSSEAGSTAMRLDGDFQRLQPRSYVSAGDTSVEGETSSLQAVFSTASAGNLRIRSTRHSLETTGADAAPDVGFEGTEIGWTKNHDSDFSSAVNLVLLDQDNFHTQGLMTPSTVPAGTSSWQLGGNFERHLRDGFAFRSGVSYRQLHEQRDATGRPTESALAREKMDAYGVATSQLHSGILVEYGLYSTLRDGSVAMSPHGGLLLNMGANWEADAVVRQRITDGDPETNDFSLAYYGGGDAADMDRHYYKLGFKRNISDVESFRVGASHREIADTLRMFFNEDFFDQVESLYLVRGDRLPELQMALSHKLGKRILATLQTQYGDGGGGLFMADDSSSFENKVRYLVTSLDTQFSRTDTGLFLAFHRIEQSLDPLAATSIADESGLDRLQLRLTQELGFLVDLGTDWALLLNVELSRGATPFTLDFDPEELRSQVAGGIAVKF